MLELFCSRWLRCRLIRNRSSCPTPSLASSIAVALPVAPQPTTPTRRRRRSAPSLGPNAKSCRARKSADPWPWSPCSASWFPRIVTQSATIAECGSGHRWAFQPDLSTPKLASCADVPSCCRSRANSSRSSSSVMALPSGTCSRTTPKTKFSALQRATAAMKSASLTMSPSAIWYDNKRDRRCRSQGSLAISLMPNSTIREELLPTSERVSRRADAWRSCKTIEKPLTLHTPGRLPPA